MTLAQYINSKTMISRYNSLAIAKYALKHTKYSNVNPILLGDDGKFWICSTPKRAYELIAAGYEEA